MRIVVASVFAFFTSSCGDLIDFTVGPSESAADCLVSDQAFREAKAKMRGAAPYSSIKVGGCEVGVDDTRTVFVTTKDEMEQVKRKIQDSRR